MNYYYQNMIGLLIILTVALVALHGQNKWEIPVIGDAPKRAVTVEDIVSVRQVGSLSISPDGKKFAMFLSQPNASRNDYRTGWFVGSMQGGGLRYVGDGGGTRFRVLPTGVSSGDIEYPASQWSSDGKWIAYTLKRRNEIQLWRSKVDGTIQEQLTHNASDIHEFAWSEDGQKLYFTVGIPRTVKEERSKKREFAGYRYDDDLSSWSDLMRPLIREVPDTNLSVWIISLDSHKERRAEKSEEEQFRRLQSRHKAGVEDVVRAIYRDGAIPPVARADGALVWLKRSVPRSLKTQVVVSLSSDTTRQILCPGQKGTGIIDRVWWNEEDNKVMFLRYLDDQPGKEICSWVPSVDSALTVGYFPGEFLTNNKPVVANRLLCVRQTMTTPPQIVMLDLNSGKMKLVVDVNPEFKNIRMGKTERIEWDTPRLSWNEPGGKLSGLYSKRAGGYILYPPDFDSTKAYPAFIEPYALFGFNSTVGQEHPLHAYAASGVIVLNFAFPTRDYDVQAKLGDSLMIHVYSEKLEYPHMTMYMESTLRGLDQALKRGFIDRQRIGIGGVSHGTFIPLYLMQKYDRITAISISASGWGPEEYYWPTRKSREGNPNMKVDWRVKPVGKGREFWSKLDIAEHVDSVEAPILMHHALSETPIAVRFMRHLADAGKPYDAYIFTNEFHLKYQPAHRYAIMKRNLDWFRFWLQDYDPTALSKVELDKRGETPVTLEREWQYNHWRELREMQKKNPRSLRKFEERMEGTE